MSNKEQWEPLSTEKLQENLEVHLDALRTCMHGVTEKPSNANPAWNHRGWIEEILENLSERGKAQLVSETKHELATTYPTLFWDEKYKSWIKAEK